MASKVHRIRFYNPQPQSINCLSYNRNKKHVAIARKDASIEIWDLNHAPLLLLFIPGVENGSVEAMAWSDNRLFTTGLGGALVEWDLQTLTMKKSVLLTGYAAWCLDVNPSNTAVAVGTEQGYINIFSIEDNDIIYKCLFDKQEGRILCCKFDKTGNILVTGSIDTIRIWNVQTGNAVNRLSASRRGKEVIVWCLSVLSDNTIVSGDSHGRLTFWDSIHGEQIESFTTHKADILALTVSDDEKSLYCSGVDAAIVNFIKVDMNNKLGFQWVKNVQRNVHEHDVRALTLQGQKLLSAGVDGYLSFSSFPPKWVMRVPPMLPRQRSCVSNKKKLLLLRYDNHIDIWKLGSYGVKNNGKLILGEKKHKNDNVEDKKQPNLEQDTIEKSTKGQPLKISTDPLKLVSIKTMKNKQLKCCAMSSDGQFVLYATDSIIRILKLETDEEDDKNVSLSKVLLNSLTVSTCENAVFTEDSHCAIISSSGTLYVLLIDPNTGASLQQSISTDKYLKSPSILHLSVCQRCPSGNTYLVAADICGAISVWIKSGKSQYQHYVSLPKYQCVPSAILVDFRHETFIATYVDQKIIEYDLVNKKYLDWSSSRLGQKWFERKSAITAIHPHPQRPDALIFEDNTSLCIFEKKLTKQNEMFEPQAKVKNWNAQNFNYKVIPIKYLSGFHWIERDEAVMVETLPENIVSQLPPTMATKRYNT